MKRSSLIALSAAGIVVSLTFGSVVARTSDSVVSEGNSAQTGNYDFSHDVQASVNEGSVDCATATYSDGPVTLVRSSTINFGQNGDAGIDPVFRTFCLKNNGSSTGALYVSIANATDVEVGACDADESAPDAGNDTTCTDGAAGELAPILELTVSNCSGSGTFRSVGAYATPVQIASLDSGVTCRIHLADRIPSSATDIQKAAAQTDRYSYDLVFTLQDA